MSIQRHVMIFYEFFFSWKVIIFYSVQFL
jgi:hypothetical protein